MEAGECLATSLGCSFFADEAIPDTSFYNVAVSVTDDATGKSVGGENFIVRSLPRKAIKVTPERYIYNGKHFLTLSDASERVSCQWFDPDGRYLGEGYTFAIGDDPVLGEYKVRVCSKKDGALVYDSLKVVNDLLQKSLKIDVATSRIYITFRHELQEDVDVIVSTTSVKGQTTHLPKGQKNYTVHYNSVGGINSVVMVTFIVNGVKTETYKLQ